MSQDYYILKMLNMKDENIHFYEEFVKEEVIKGKRCLVYQAYLTYIPEYCPKCGTCYDKNIEKHGFKNSFIKIPSVSKLTTYLSLRRYSISLIILFNISYTTSLDSELKIIISSIRLMNSGLKVFFSSFITSSLLLSIFSRIY